MVGAGVAVFASDAGVQLCPSAPGGDAASFGTASAASSLAAGPPSLSLPCLVRPASGCVRRSLPTQVDVIAARPAVGWRMQAGSVLGTAPRPLFALLAGGRLLLVLPLSLLRKLVESPPPTAGCSLTGGTPSMSQPTFVGDHSPRSGPSGWRPCSSATEDWSCMGLGVVCPPSFGRGRHRPLWPSSGLGHRPGCSFPVSPGPHQELHSMEALAGVPSARCRTFLASIYGFMSATSPAFHIHPSPLLRSLDDTNLALPKFLEDQTVHGFLPVTSCRHCR